MVKQDFTKEIFLELGLRLAGSRWILGRVNFGGVSLRLALCLRAVFFSISEVIFSRDFVRVSVFMSLTRGVLYSFRLDGIISRHLKQIARDQTGKWVGYMYKGY